MGYDGLTTTVSKLKRYDIRKLYQLARTQMSQKHMNFQGLPVNVLVKPIPTKVDDVLSI